MFCDLHAHSTASDGTDPPQALARLALDAGLQAFALTDHDTTRGLAPCARAARELGIDFIPGIEVSADPAAASDGLPLPCQGALHILGYYVRDDDPQLESVAAQMTRARDERNPAIVRRLRALGIDLDYAEVERQAVEQGAHAIGRPHIAQALVAKGVVPSVKEAFTRFLGKGAAAYERRDQLHPAAAIEAIHHAGGLAVLAHPVQLGLLTPQRGEPQLQRFLDNLAACGLDGIEALHPDHEPEHARLFFDLAQRHAWLTTGGSDYHGTRKPAALGCQRVPLAFAHALRRRRDR
jgi:predicted metal-dependent phosphoesterase TrpH